MKRLKNFILGLLIVVIVGFLLFMYIKDSRISQYQDYFLQFNWFQPLLIGLAGLLILIGLILVLSIFKPTYRKPGLYKEFDDGHVYVSRKAVEKTVYFVPNNVQATSLTESIRADIKQNVEHFTEMPVRKLEVNVKDQKTSGPRVL